MTVNDTTWKHLSIADRETPFNNDEALLRIKAWAGGSVEKYRSAFLWANPAGPANNTRSYRLTIGDIVNGRLVMIPHAVFAAAGILSGAHGGLEGVVDEPEKLKLKSVVTEIYNKFRDMWGDPRQVPPWLHGGNTEEQVQASAAVGDGEGKVESVTAAAAPVRPSRSCFDNPNLPGPTKPIVTPEGRFMGHIAAWGQCHMGIGDACVMAPKSKAGYKYFTTGTVLTADGSIVDVGKITLGTGHADPRLGWIPAAEHYDNSGTTVVIAAVGEDQWGIWGAGVTVAEATEERIAELRRSPISGDWRRVNGNLELVAALGVNNPGFPILSLSAAGEPQSLTAAGVLNEDGSMFGELIDEVEATPEPSAADIRALERLALLDEAIGSIRVGQRQQRYKALMRR